VSVVLETGRLLLREFVPEDVDAYAALIGDPETMRYYPRPYTRDEARDLIEPNRARYRVHGFGVWALEERRTGVFLGDCRLAVSLVEGIPEVEVMWHVVRDRCHRGSPLRQRRRLAITPSARSDSAAWWPWSGRRTTPPPAWPASWG
jgi:RimJ/RimL family protein N-acetyltransferase